MNAPNPRLTAGNDPRAAPRRVLAVVDDADLRAAVADHLGGLGYAVHAVSDGAAFVEVVSRVLLHDDGGAPPEAVLTDVHLPDFDGLRIVEGLRLAGWDVPVLVLAGPSDAALQRRVASLGRAELLPKPLDLGRLTAALHRALR